MKKKLILLALSLILIVGTLFILSSCNEPDAPASSPAEETDGKDDPKTPETSTPLPPTEGLEYKLNNNGVSYSVKGLGTATDVTELVIPSTYEGKPVTSIGSEAFRGCTGLTSIVIPNSVTSIGDDAFRGCTGLTSVTIGNSVESIGDDAFQFCYKLVEVYNLSSSITVTKGSWSNGYVGYHALDVYTDVNAESKLSNVNGYILYSNGTNRYLMGYTGSDTNLTLPENIGGENYSIYKRAFYDNDKITSVIIPNSVTTIDDVAFYDCTGLTSIVIPNSVTSIGSDAFEGCTGLTSVTIGNGVISIGDDAFAYCYGLTSVTFEADSKLTSIGASAFYRCEKLVEVYNLSSSITVTKGSWSNGYVGCYALDVYTDANAESKLSNVNGCIVYNNGTDRYLIGYTGSDTKLTLPENIGGENYSIYKYAFDDNDKITSVIIPNSVTSIGSSAFEDCDGLTNITIPDSVESIGDSAFEDCDGLTSVTIGNSVTSIGDEAFYSCDGLTSITIPGSVTSIGSSAFEYCTGLTSITFADTSTWYRTTSSSHNYFGGTQTHVTVPTNNATYFKSTYCSYYWYKK